MPNGADPAAVRAALSRAEDAFENVGGGAVTFEAGIDTDADWKTQLTKACRLLQVAGTLHRQNGYHTAVIEVCFGAIERSIEAYALWATADTLEDFQDHTFCYDRAQQIGLFENETAEQLKDLYSENRTSSYYGGSHPTATQADAMTTLATTVHQFSVTQIREGGVCLCED